METKNVLATDGVIRCLAALAQPTRLAIFRRLVVAGPTGLAAGELAHDTATAPATLSFHLKELTHAGLVRAAPQGRFIFYSANFLQMRAVLSYLTQNCCADDSTNHQSGCPPFACGANECTPELEGALPPATAAPSTGSTHHARPRGRSKVNPYGDPT